jgi:YbgC/YbaW family acyl-CoA thioester hydrolase
VDVRFQDIDAAGIVFFSRFFEYAHAAYETFLAENGFPLARVLKEGQWAAPLRHVEADYRAPVRFGEQLGVQLVLAYVQESEITLGFRIVRVDAKVCATVQTVHTFVSPRDFQRREVPSGLVRALEPISR